MSYKGYKEQRYRVMQAIESCNTIIQLGYANKMVKALEERWPDVGVSLDDGYISMHGLVWIAYYNKLHRLMVIKR